MTERHRMDIFDAPGVRTITWNPADADEVEAAHAEFERLRGLGYATFSVSRRATSLVVERRVDEFPSAAGSVSARRIPEQTDRFEPEAPRYVAVRPMRGG